MTVTYCLLSLSSDTLVLVIDTVWRSSWVLISMIAAITTFKNCSGTKLMKYSKNKVQMLDKLHSLLHLSSLTFLYLFTHLVPCSWVHFWLIPASFLLSGQAYFTFYISCAFFPLAEPFWFSFSVIMFQAYWAACFITNPYPQDLHNPG